MSLLTIKGFKRRGEFTPKSGLTLVQTRHPLLRVLVLTLWACSLAQGVSFAQGDEPELLTYEELIRLFEQENPPEPLQSKLNRLLTTPFVSNEAHAGGVRPLKPRTAQLGPFLRVAFWNIQRGLDYKAVEVAFTDPAKFATVLDTAKYPPGSKQRAHVLEQAQMLSQADVILLNEVDWGMARTSYRHTAKELAAALRMNYAYGVEFVELSPVAPDAKTCDKATAENTTKPAERVDPARYKGLHGTAILSRFRSRRPRARGVRPTVPQGRQFPRRLGVHHVAAPANGQPGADALPQAQRA